GAARRLSSRAAGPGDGGVRPWGNAWTDPRPDARRLAYGFLQLELGVLRQCAGRHSMCPRHPAVPRPARRPANGRTARLARICDAQSRYWGAAAIPRPRRAALLVRLPLKPGPGPALGG